MKVGKKEPSSTLIILLLSASILVLASNVQLVAAEGTVYIRADGSIDPPTAPIQREGDRYTITGNITATTLGQTMVK